MSWRDEAAAMQPFLVADRRSETGWARDRDVLAIFGQGLLVLMLLGAYREGGQLGDPWVMVVLGVIGLFLNATGVTHAPSSTTVPPRQQSIAERQQCCRFVPAPGRVRPQRAVSAQPVNNQQAAGRRALGFAL